MRATLERPSRRALVCLVGVGLAVLLISAGALAVAGEVSDGDMYKIDDGHGLANEEAVSAYETEGYASGEVEGLDATIEVAESKELVERTGPRPLDAAHGYVRIDYREDISRTLRIYLPRSMVTPYAREEVESLGSSEITADYQPAREGRYFQITISVGGPTDVVVPTHAHSEITYGVLDRYEDRVDSVTGADREWQYLEREGLEREHAVAVEVEDVDDVVIHHDATPDEPEETWVNTPRDSGDGPYWYAPDSEEGEVVYVVTRGGDAPDVRLMEGGGVRQKVEGHVNDARQIPERIRDGVRNPGEWLFS